MKSDGGSHNAEFASIAGLIELWREEEERLQTLVDDVKTSIEVRGQAKEKLAAVAKTIKSHEEELARLQAEA